MEESEAIGPMLLNLYASSTDTEAQFHKSASRISVYHDEDHPSALILPVTSGNVIGTYITGGKPFTT